MEKLIEIDKFKLIVMSKEVSDAECEKYFLDFEVGNSDEIKDICNILIKYRPKVADKIDKIMKGNLRFVVSQNFP